MKLFIGTKTLKAIPTTRAEYLTYRGWKLPENENPKDQGYLVEYTDGGQPNDPRHEGYISWSPKDVFEAAYIELGNVAHLAPHQIRVIGEAAQLNDKLNKLTDFLHSDRFSNVDPDEQKRLRDQVGLMHQYSGILAQRIAAF